MACQSFTSRKCVKLSKLLLDNWTSHIPHGHIRVVRRRLTICYYWLTFCSPTNILLPLTNILLFFSFFSSVFCLKKYFNKWQWKIWTIARLWIAWQTILWKKITKRLKNHFRKFMQPALFVPTVMKQMWDYYNYNYNASQLICYTFFIAASSYLRQYLIW